MLALLALGGGPMHKPFYGRGGTKQGAPRKIMRVGWDPKGGSGSGGMGQWVAHTGRCGKAGEMCKQKGRGYVTWQWRGGLAT